MSLAARVTRAPIPFDAARGQDVAADYGATGPLRDLIAGTAGSSPYLHGLLVKERAWAESAFDDPEAAFDALLAGTATQTASNGTQLRIAKGRMALLVALCDLGGLWSLEEVTGALSRFADVAVDRALSVALAPLQAAGKLPSDPKLTVLAMGKLGAQELNYSS
ncbi:MAG: glutamine-synthetase adenylyltransferase, partial [Pseudomonadota bacterium]